MTRIRSALRAVAVAAALSWSTAGVLAAEDPVVATVNGEKILKSHLIEAQRLLPPQYQKIPMEQIFPGLVDSVVDAKLASADARVRKMHEDPAFKSQMARIENQLLQRMVLQKEMESGVTDEAVQARYKKMAAGMGEKEEIHARHILLKTEDEAKAVIESLKKDADFAKLAKEKSTGPSGPGGGDLGFFAKGQMVPAFEKAAFALDKGEYTDTPVQTKFGWHVIKLEGKRKAEVPPFEKMAEQLRGQISQERATSYIEKLRGAAKIERFDLDGKPLTAAKPK